jgi:hypothetical protein
MGWEMAQLDKVAVAVVRDERNQEEKGASEQS